MSTRTQTRVHARGMTTQAIDGANARVLAASPAPEGPVERLRTPLSVVPATTGNRRAHFAIFCFGVMLAALAGVLVLNVQVSSAQYELVGLRNTERALTQENESLTQRAQNLEAPQNVAAKAAELGMVVPGSVASVDLGTLKVSGVSTPAEKEKAPTSLVAVPNAPYAAPEATDPVAAAPQAVAETTPEAAVEDSVQNEQDAVPAEGGETEPSATGSDSGANDRPTFSANELNGGTIPAPAQQGADG